MNIKAIKKIFISYSHSFQERKELLLKQVELIRQFAENIATLLDNIESTRPCVLLSDRSDEKWRSIK